MPLTGKGETIKSAMSEQYGPEKGERVFYASKNAGTITGVDAMDYPPSMTDQKPEDCADNAVGGIVDQGSNIGQEPPPLPAPEFEHPQEHPNASTPPEPALDKAFGQRDAAAGYGGVAGGAIPQTWGDALPQAVGLNDMCRNNAATGWPQWKGTE